MPVSIPNINKINAAIARKDFAEYIKLICPGYRMSKFHKALADILTRFAYGELTNIIITAPPQHGKSEIFSRLLPGYLFAVHSAKRKVDIIATSYGDSLVKKNSMAAKRYIQSKVYRRLFPEVLGSDADILKDAKSTQNIWETRVGTYLASAIRSGITGHGASFVLIDDPVKNRAEAESERIRNAIWDEYTSSILTRWRRELPVRGGIGITLTRWHDDDLAGRLIKLQESDPKADQFAIFNFPAIYGE